jgi:hypothetical protein
MPTWSERGDPTSVAQWILELMALPDQSGDERSSRTVQKSCSYHEGAQPLPTLRISDVRLQSNAALADRIFSTDGHITKCLRRCGVTSQILSEGN